MAWTRVCCVWLVVILHQAASGTDLEVIEPTSIKTGGRLSTGSPIYGNDVCQRGSFLEDSDKVWLEYDSPLPEGTLSKYFLYIDANVTKTEPNDLLLQIYRPGSEKNKVTLVWQAVTAIEAEDFRNALLTFELTSGFHVKQGDFIGWSSLGSIVPISFDYTETHRTLFFKKEGRDVKIGESYEFNNTHLPATFSVAAEVITRSIQPSTTSSSPTTTTRGSLEVSTSIISDEDTTTQGATATTGPKTNSKLWLYLLILFLGIGLVVVVISVVIVCVKRRQKATSKDKDLPLDDKTPDPTTNEINYQDVKDTYLTMPSPSVTSEGGEYSYVDVNNYNGSSSPLYINAAAGNQFPHSLVKEHSKGPNDTYTRPEAVDLPADNQYTSLTGQYANQLSDPVYMNSSVGR